MGCLLLIWFWRFCYGDDLYGVPGWVWLVGWYWYWYWYWHWLILVGWGVWVDRRFGNGYGYGYVGSWEKRRGISRGSWNF